ncbi:unnamed protein product [Albugo candida]|uniref:Uncharacterized protein n=1 Tax=Albugo candida TaxID=65357 RepID=A0A024FUP2_9STRA|nr:unnamed protein product [Albugo candida]|eukprot:CCI10761.1 unnamed protein product [Albugo candida]
MSKGTRDTDASNAKEKKTRKRITYCMGIIGHFKYQSMFTNVQDPSLYTQPLRKNSQQWNSIPAYENVNYLQLSRIGESSVTSTPRQENVSLQTSYRPKWTIIIKNLNFSSVKTCKYSISKQCTCNLNNSTDDKKSESLRQN